jgi:hypothetical protein
MTIPRYIQVILTKLHSPTIVQADGLKFYCPTFTEMWRAETIRTKEPETIKWIDGFQPNSVLWDFGANVGTYTIYAAKKGHFVVAIEPSTREYEILKRNIELNGVWVDVKNIAAGIDTDYRLFHSNPDYIKIDTDGHDIKILKGLVRCNVLPVVKEISIEVEPNTKEEIIEILYRNKFKLKSWGHSPMMDGTPYEKYDNLIFERGE